MQDEIVFLGTGGDSIVVGKQMRASGGFIIQSMGNQFHVDPGPGSLIRAMQANVNPRETIAVFASHSHLNHANDVNAAISAMTYNGMDKHGLLVAPSEVEREVVSDFFKSCVERYVAFNDDSKVGINEIEVEALPAKHYDTDCVGFKFTSPKHTISYTSDTEYFKGLGEAHQDVDVMIVNCKLSSEQSSKGHMNPDDVVELLNEAEPEMAVLTHFGVKLLREGPVDVARGIQKETSCQVLAAKDGMVVNPNTFASKVRQKKLTGFK